MSARLRSSQGREIHPFHTPNRFRPQTQTDKKEMEAETEREGARKMND